MASTPTRAVNPARQLSAIRSALPAATGTIRRGELHCQVSIQPSPASQRYTVRLRYRHGRRPRVTVAGPPLARHPGAHNLPHVYPGDEPCLYYPGQWRHDMLLAATILPWTSEWLLHYELWLITGTWTGGGHSARGNAAAVAHGGPVCRSGDTCSGCAVEHLPDSVIDPAVGREFPEVREDLPVAPQRRRYDGGGMLSPGC
jgi:hypothetical protein